MKRTQRIWVTSICAIACLLGARLWLHTKPVHAQQDSNYYYDGYFYIYAAVDFDTSGTLYVESYMEVDLDPDEDIDEIEVDGYADEDGELIAEDYADGDDYYPADLQLSGTVPTGHEYGMESDGYACCDDDDGEGDDGCDWYYVGYTYAYVQVARYSAALCPGWHHRDAAATHNQKTHHGSCNSGS